MAIIVAWMLVALAVPSLQIREPFMLALEALALNVWLVGTVLGLAMGLNWLATALSNRVNRAFARITLVAFCTYLQTLWGVSYGWKYTIDLMGMLLIQSIYFRVIGVPDWILRGKEVAQTIAKPSQFRIVDVLVWTTGLAILLALSIRFDPPVDGVRYWPLLCLLWLVAPMAATCWTLAGLAPGWSRAQLFWFATGALVLGTVAGGLEFAERRVLNQGKMNIELLALYGIMFGGFGLTILLFSLAGRWQGRVEPAKFRTTDGKPPVPSGGD